MSVSNMENKNNRKALQILRGSNSSIVNRKDEELLDGQLLYNKTKNYITVGNNKSKFDAQPIRVRELGGYSTDDGTITNNPRDEFYIRHSGGALHIFSGDGIVFDEGTPSISLNSSSSFSINVGTAVESHATFTISNSAVLNTNCSLSITNSISAQSTITTGKYFKGDVGTTTDRSNVYGNEIKCTSMEAEAVSCSGNASLNTISTASIKCTGQIEAESFNAKSDIRLKTNIKGFDYHDSILDIPIREYDWKDSGKHAIGFIAQDLKEVYPELVDENEEGILSIKETKLVYLLIEEVRKLKKEIEELKK